MMVSTGFHGPLLADDSNAAEESAIAFLTSVGGDVDKEVVRVQNTPIGEKVVDALLQLSNISSLQLDGSTFESGQFQRLHAINASDVFDISLTRTNVTTGELRSVLNRRRIKNEKHTVHFVYFWESPISGTDVMQLVGEFPDVSFHYVSKSDVDAFLLNQVKRMAREVFDDSETIVLDQFHVIRFGRAAAQILQRSNVSELIIQNYPASAAFIVRGTKRLDSGEVDDAIADFSTVIGRTTDETIKLERSVAHHYLGKAYAAKSKFTLALEQYSRAGELGIDHYDFKRDRATALRETGRFNEAIAELSIVIRDLEQAQDAVEAEYQHDIDEWTRKANQSVARHLETYMASLPDAYLERAAVYEAAGDFESALADCNVCLERLPEHAEAYNRRALIYKKMRKYDMAIADWSQVVELSPVFAQAYYYRGQCWLENGSHGNAVFDFTLCLNRNPKHVDALYARALQWRDAGEFDRSVADLRNLLEIDPVNAGGNCLMASLLSRCPQDDLRDGKRGLLHATRACEATDWKMPCCLAALAAAYAETGDFVKAIEWAEKAIDISRAKEFDAADYKARVRSYRKNSAVRLAATVSCVDVVRQCEIIEKIAVAGGRVRCRYQSSHRELTIEFGGIDSPFLSFFGDDEYDVTLTTEMAADWKSLEGLRNLWLSRVRVEAPAQQHLAKLPDLRNLTIDECDFTDETQFDDSAFRHLEALNLHKMHLTESVVALVERMPKLRLLKVAPCTHDRGEYFDRLLSNRSLQDVIVWTKYFTDEHIEGLARLPRLNRIELQLFGDGVSGPSKHGIENLAKALHQRKLHMIIDQYQPFMNSDDVKLLLAEYPNLQFEYDFNIPHPNGAMDLP